MAIYIRRWYGIRLLILSKADNFWGKKDQKKEQEESNSKYIYLSNLCTPFNQGAILQSDIALYSFCSVKQNAVEMKHVASALENALALPQVNAVKIFFRNATYSWSDKVKKLNLKICLAKETCCKYSAPPLEVLWEVIIL